MNNRRKVRIRALQSLYASEISGNTFDQILNDPILKNSFKDSIRQFYESLIGKTIENKDKFDILIEKKSKNWEFNRIAVIDKVILRQAICEFLYFPDIPPKVTIDEAIEISKIFSTGKSGRFINGLLDSILLDLNKEKK